MSTEESSSEIGKSEKEYSKDEELECAVCLQTCVHPVRLPCSHIFCFLCVKGVANQSKRCAMCRQEIPADFLDNPNLLKKIDEKETEAEGYQWFYEGRNGWWQYDERTSLDLENAYCGGQRLFEVLVAGFLYTVDFDRMVQQRRNDPSRRRRIKRDLATIPKKGVAGLKTDLGETSDHTLEEQSQLPSSTEQVQVASIDSTLGTDSISTTFRPVARPSATLSSAQSQVPSSSTEDVQVASIDSISHTVSTSTVRPATRPSVTSTLSQSQVPSSDHPQDPSSTDQVLVSSIDSTSRADSTTTFRPPTRPSATSTSAQRGSSELENLHLLHSDVHRSLYRDFRSFPVVGRRPIHVAAPIIPRINDSGARQSSSTTRMQPYLTDSTSCLPDSSVSSSDSVSSSNVGSTEDCEPPVHPEPDSTVSIDTLTEHIRNFALGNDENEYYSLDGTEEYNLPNDTENL